MVDIKKYHPSRGIKNIEFSRRTLGQCITVEAEDSLYVIDQYVVTHNTIMSVVASIESGSEKVLIVCPANAKINWFREINAYLPEEEISIIKSGHWNPKRYTIINYDILKNFHTIIDGRKTYKEHEINRHLDNEGFDLIILDEAHMVKNPSSNRAKIISQISKNIKRRWLLTGTPLANRPMDFYNLLKICDSPVTASWKQYAFRYCDGKKFRKKLKTGVYKDIWLTDGASNLEELHDRTKNLILRRKKDDHLDLPPKIVAPYYVEIDDMNEYHKAFDEYLEWAKSEGKRLGNGRHMVELIVLRKYLALEKTKQSIELAEQAIENGQKVIIFTNFTHSFDALMNHFGKLAVGHNGKMSGVQKQNSVDRFQNDENVMVFVGNLISAGTAITLTEAEVVIMNDLDFVPANHAQAEDRAHRIGSTSTTNVYYPIAVGTIDEMMFKILEKKRKIIDTVIGDDHVSMTIEDDLFGEFINTYL
jgi:SWI/SNF-related matrix-associated actin-dependent regulator 1 of chromatin subfamily A